MSAEPHARLILVRHGQSEANAANRFTGWSNPPLTERGREEAAILARRLMDAGVLPDRVFCSALQRSADTARIMLATMAREDVPLVCNLALNERDYGGLAGMNKAEAAERFGAEQVHRWRRSYTERPPEGESLRDTAARVLAYYVNTVLPQVMQGGNTLIVAHGNSLRALVMALDGLNEEGIEKFSLSTGTAVVYELTESTAFCGREVLSRKKETA